MRLPVFLPWSLPAAACLTFGILAAYGLVPFWLTVLACALGLLFGLLLRFPMGVLVTLLLLPVGYLRMDYWQGRQNPLEPLFGQTLTLSGLSDGELLRLDELGARVVLTPRGSVQPGRVTLRGELALAAGKRNPGGFDYRAYLLRRGVWGQVFVDEVLEHESARLGVRSRLRRAVAVGLPEQEAALALAIHLGVRDDLGELRELFADSGLAHLLALSGLNVAILVAALGFALRPLGLWRYPALMAIVVGFLLVVEPSPSVFRAGVMALVVLLSLWLGGGRLEVGPTLALSALGLLLWNPSWLFDISFQLSYLAVAGLLVFVQPVTERFLGKRHLSEWHWKQLTLGAVVVSLAAQAATLPLIASAFGSLPILSALVNVLAVPIASALVPLGFVVALVGLVSLPLAALLNKLALLLYKALIWIAAWGAALPNLVWGEIAWLGYALYYLALLALALVAWKQLRLWQGLLVVLVAGLCSLAARPPNPAPEIIFLDVGQGDSTLIRLPGRQEILVDGGGSPFSDFDVGGRTVLPALKALGVDELELVIVTHTDADHMEGVVSVLAAIPVNELAIGVRSDGDPLFDKLMETAARRGVPVIALTRGESLSLGEATLDIFHPSRFPYEADNDNSVSFVLRYRGVPKALFMGDLSVNAERGFAVPDVDIVMAAHHGSGSSTSAALLRAAQPETVVLSYGRNTYSHPHPELMARLEASGALIRETFEEGAIRLPLAP